MRNLFEAKALAHALVAALLLLSVLAVMSDVAPVYAASVTQPILVATPSGGSAFTYTVSGCSVYPTLGSSGPTATTFTASSSCLLTVTMPSTGTNTTYVFASSASSTTVTTCLSGTCALFAPSDYYQLSQTYTANSANAFPASSTVDLEGTQGGAFDTRACSIPTGGTTSASCASGSNWFDYDTPVGFWALSNQGTSTNQWSATPVTYGLTSYYACDEATSGGIVRVMDLSGNGITASPTNAPTYTTGEFGGACDFVASGSQRLTTSHSPVMDVSTALGWSAWVYLNSDTGKSMVPFSWNGAGGTPLIIPFIGTSNLLFQVDFHWNDSISTYYDSGISITAGKWYFLAVTYDGSDIRSYIGAASGPPVAGTVTPAAKTLGTNSYGSTIGSAGSSDYWNGYLDDMKTYNRAPSASEVAENFYGVPQVTIFTDTTGGNAHAVAFYSQFADNAQYTVNGGGAPAAPYLTGVSIGSTMTSFLQLTTSAQTVWLDAGSAWSTTNPKTEGISIEQWDLNAASGTTSGNAASTIDPTYLLTYNVPIIALVTVAVGVSLVVVVLIFRRYLTFTWRQ